MNTIVDPNQPHITCSNIRRVTWTLAAGTTDQPLATQDYSDGYKVTSQIYGEETTTPDILVGACVIFTVNQGRTEDYANGALCHAIANDSTTASSMASYSHVLFHITGTSDKWKSNGTLELNRGSISGILLDRDTLETIDLDKRSDAATTYVTYNPLNESSAKTAMLQVGVNPTASWYQPISSPLYTGIKRFQKDDYVRGYSVTTSGWSTGVNLVSC